MQQPRTNGVTIMFSGQVMVTQEPTEQDHQLVATMVHLNQKWVKEGKPLSNQGL